VAEQLLDLAQIRTHVEQVSRVAVPKPMRMYAVDNAYTPRTDLQDPPDVSRSETACSTVFRS
jgi:hypothetical protein